jgi:hypothetical protein
MSLYNGCTAPVLKSVQRIYNKNNILYIYILLLYSNTILYNNLLINKYFSLCGWGGAYGRKSVHKP